MEEIDPEEKSSSRVIFFIVFGAAAIFVLYQFFYRSQSKIDVKQDFNKTEGWIVKYFNGDSSDAGNGRTITYAYKVGSRIYSRYVFTIERFNECEDTIGKECAEKRFWVIYSKKNPNKSLINLHLEIQGLKSPDFPTSIEDFI